MKKPIPDFERVLEEARALQAHLPWMDLVVVGGTAAAIHAQHRYSTDTDHVSPKMRAEFEVVLDQLRDWEGWDTARVRRPFVILGERHQVELGVRQMRRTISLDTVDVDSLRVPTPEETLRIKAFLCTQRQSVRDFLDVAAMVDLLGEEHSLEALRYLNVLYEGEGNQSAITRFAEVACQQPIDLEEVELSSYKGIQAPYQDWKHVESRCKEVAKKLLLMEMEGRVATQEQEFFQHAPTTRRVAPERGGVRR